MTHWIPTYDNTAGRLQVESYIANKPTDAEFRGNLIRIRVGEPSMRRRMELATIMEDVADIDAYMVLPVDDPAPKPNSASDEIKFDGHTYRITQTQLMAAKGCYNITLTKLNF